jgi:drug/metabolite transporter (DMT)-like permease
MSFVIVLIASVLFGVIPSIQKLVLLDGVSLLVLVLICNSFSAAFTLAVCLAAHKSLAVTKRQLLDLFWIGVSLFLTDWLLNLAYTLMPVGPTTMVHFLYPSLVCAAMAVFFGQRIRLRRAAGIVLSVLGLFLMAGSFSGSSRSGVAVAAMSAAAYAFYMIASEKTSAGRLDPGVRAFFTSAFSAVSALPAVLYRPLCLHEKIVLPATGQSWFWCLLVGAMFCAATVLLHTGIRRIGAGDVSFINMLEPVTSMLVSGALYRDTLSAAALAGCAAIAVSLLFTASSEERDV